MDSLDPTERALAERVEIRRQQLREAEEGLELYRRDVEMQRQIALDHALALTLQDAEDPERPLQWRLRIDDEEDEEDDDESTLSDLIDEVVVRNDPNQRTCVTCLDDLSDQDAHRCPCRHDWCQTCIVNRYEMAARSTHLFPAQCCNQPILPDNHELVAPETWARYFEKKTEVETPNPTFCSKRDCSKFIPLRDIIEGRAKCVCEHVTCTSCKAEWHDGECVVDPETEQVLSLAREQQWQTCFHCREMVVRRDGCNEMGMYTAMKLSWNLLTMNQQNADVAALSAMRVGWSGRHVSALSLGVPSLLTSKLPGLGGSGDGAFHPSRLVGVLSSLSSLACLSCLSRSITLASPSKKHPPMRQLLQPIRGSDLSYQ